MGATPHDLNSWETGRRIGPHQRDPELEGALKHLNERIAAGKLAIGAPPAVPELPVVFIVGCARSGSTLLLQWLANAGTLCYPTNIMSRFYADAGLGALVHRVLHDLDRRGEIFPEGGSAPAFRSELGRSKGAAAPHDFGYFWRNYFSFGDHQGELTRKPGPKETADMVGDIAAIQRVFGKPLVMKAMQLDWHIPLLYRAFPGSLFLFSRRDPMRNAWSLMKARQDYFGDATHWYSFKPEEYDRIKELPPWEQCVAQVHYTEQAVVRGLSELPGEAWMTVRHEAFCDDPHSFHARIASRIGIDAVHPGPGRFEVREHNIPQELVERGERLLGELRGA